MHSPADPFAPPIVPLADQPSGPACAPAGAGTARWAAPRQALRICLFGDSHLASVKHAQDRGLIDWRGHRMEFWGAYGPAFRQLELRGDAVHPKPDARPIVAEINGAGREVLQATDFDAFLFYGARLRMSEFMPPLLETLCAEDGHVSTAVRRILTRRFLRGCRAYRFARAFAAANPAARVVFAPAPLLTEGRGGPDLPQAAQASPTDRDQLRHWLDAEAGQDRITLLHQPEETITGGYLTRIEHASDEIGQEDDPVHKNADFAAMTVGRFLAEL
ncbi:hypothetical protein [Pseudooceanicola aestuarii]|uniref:hypothetical protein n=1 Tax=Pseudooceanicola aestuarii TaxID=2697319 RepID=UPI0013D39C3F|nr:hypothetical protein [Pseudooceanicola aestuarii]